MLSLNVFFLSRSSFVTSLQALRDYSHIDIAFTNVFQRLICILATYVSMGNKAYVWSKDLS